MCLAEALLRIPDKRHARRADPRQDQRRQLAVAPGPERRRCSSTPPPGACCSPASWWPRIAESGLSKALTRIDRQGRRAADPQGRGHGHAPDGRAVRDRRDHLRGARQRPQDTRPKASAIRTTCSAKPPRPRPTRQRYQASYEQAIHAIGKAARGRGIYEGPASRSSCPPCIRATAALAARARDRELLRPRVQALTHAGAPVRHRPEHRRGRGRPPGNLARPARSASASSPSWTAGTASASWCRRYQKRCPFVIDYADRPRAPQPAPPDGAPGQGRLLGQRDQARAGGRPGGLPGLHAQGLHRRVVHRLRARSCWPRPTRSIRSSPRTTRTRCRRSITSPATTTTPASTSSSACTAWASRCTRKWWARWPRAS